MIGNDVVDLQLAAQQSNWQRKGWLSKLFTPSEQVLIQNALTPEHKVWELWSRKEAAYKAHQRRFGLAPRYNPKALECDAYTNVSIEGESYRTTTTQTLQYVHSIAQATVNCAKYEYQLLAKSDAKALFLNEMATFYKVPLQHVRLIKDAHRTPKLYCNQEEMILSFSLSHHGRYAAYVYCDY